MATAPQRHRVRYACVTPGRETRWDEPVAVVTVDGTVDAAYPTLVVHGVQAAGVSRRPRDDRGSLAAPYVPRS
jgi:hypothetical protein